MAVDEPVSMETIAKLKQQAETISSEGDLESALALLDQAEALAQTLGDPLAMGLVWRGRAHAWQVHSFYEASLEAVNQAVAIYEAHGTPAEVAKAQVTAVYKLGLMGRFEEAFTLADRIRPHFVDDPFFQAVLAENLAPLYRWTSQYQRAIETYERAWALFTELEMPLRATHALHNIGVAAREMDDLSLARDCFMRAYPQYTATNNILAMLKTQFNLARLCVRQNQLQTAMTHLAQARADAEHLPPGSPNVAYVDVYQARVYQALNQPREAEHLLRRALSLFVQSGWQLDIIKTHVELGHLLAGSQVPETQAEGLACLEKAAQQLAGLQMPLLTASVQLSQAELMLRLQRTDEAINQAQQAYKLFTETNLPLRGAQARIVWADCCWRQQPDTARQHYEAALEVIGGAIPLLAARCWRGLGRLAQQRGDSLAAERAYAQAVQMLNNVRRSLSSHQHQAGFLKDKQTITSELLTALHQQPEAAEKLFTWVERFKATSLADLLFRQPLDNNTDTHLQTLIAEREQVGAALDRHWSDLTFQSSDSVSELSQRGAAPALRDTHQIETVSSLTRRLQVLEAEIAQHQDNAYAWRDGVTIGSRRIHSLLDEQTVLVSYYAAGEQLHALTVTQQPGDIRIHPLPATWQEVARQWQQTRRRVMRPGSSQPDVQQRLSRLWQMLIAPLESRLQGKGRLLILPHRHLFHVPFASLYNDQQQRYLVETWQLQQAPSATIWAYCRQRAAGEKPPLLLGYPGVRGQADYLEAVSGEVEDLARLWPRATVLLHEAATRAHFWDAAPGCAIIHLAGHIYYDDADPLASGMPLADGRWLRASDLYLRYGQLAGATVVLSGCESARVELAGSDVLGLTSAFLYAGATTLVAGLWKVDDAATAVLMQAFYQALSQGQPVAQALQSAQLHLLHQKTTAHPYYWAPFTINGGSPHLATV